MGRIAEESIQQVIAASNIVEVVSSYFPLKRAGTSYKACCPFHNERSPSFSVNPTRNTFHCFGCGKGGNAIGFVMEYENLPFADTVRKLAAKFSITLVEDATSPEAQESAGRRARLLTLHQEIAQWFHRMLLKSPAADEARAYLKKRGLNSDTARRWLIGYAPREAGFYHTWAREKGFAEDLMAVSGFLKPPDEEYRGGRWYAPFGHRVMFPIHNDHGDVIAFSGRILEANPKKAKYTNSPETELFNKSGVFFGLNKSKRAIHKAQTAVICEGQIDMISCFEHGIENVVAAQGTAFTDQHARLLKRHADQVVLCYDSDNAGQEAAQKCFVKLATEGIFVKMATLPAGDDPDSLLRREGADALRALLDGARDFFDALIDRKTLGVAPDNLRDRMRILKEIAESLSYLTERTVLDASLNRAATKLGVAPDELRRMTSAHLKTRQTQESRQAANQASRQPFVEDTPDYGDEDHPEAAVPAVLIVDNNALRLLLRLCLTSTAARDWLRQGADGPAWKGLSGAELLERAVAAVIDPDKPETVTGWMGTLSSAEQSALAAILHAPGPGAEVDAKRSAEHAVLRLRLDAIKGRMDILKNGMRLNGAPPAELLAMTGEVMSLQKEFLDLQARLRDIPEIR